MAVVLVFDFDNEEEALAFKDSKNLVAVYKRPTIFCANGPECRPYTDKHRRGFQSTLRKWFICQVCGKFINIVVFKDAKSMMDNWLRYHNHLGRNILDTFRTANVGDKL